MQSPKIFKIGTEKIQRKGLWPIAVSSGQLNTDKPLAEIKQELKT